MKRLSFLASIACGCFLASQGCGGDTSSSQTPAAGGAGGEDAGADAAPDGALPEASPDGSSDAGPLKGTVGPLQFLGPWGGQVTRIVASPKDPDLVFAIASSKLFQSKSGGAWEQLAVTDYSTHVVLPLADGRIYAGTDLDVMLSNDDGKTWTSVSTGSIEPGYSFGVQVKGLAYQAGSPGRVWAGLASFATAAIWYLEDGGNAWKPWTAPPGWVPNPSGSNPPQISDLQVRHDTSANTDFIVATYDKAFSSGGGVYCSRDSGATFADCGAGLPSGPFHRVSAYDGITLIAGGHPFGNAYAGVWYSTDQCETWKEFNGGVTNPIANDVKRLQDGTFAAGSYSGGWITASTAGGNWTADPDLDGQEVSAVFEASNGDLLAGSSTLGVKRKTSGATGWQNASTGLALTASIDATVDPASASSMLVSINAENSGMVLQTSQGIDGWGPIPALPHPRYTHVTIAPSGKWYVVSDGPTTQANDGIYVSADKGASWNFLGPITDDLMDQEITGIAELPGGGLLAAGATWPESAVFFKVSQDSGDTWTDAFLSQQEGPRPGRLSMTEAGDALMPVMPGNQKAGGLLRMPKGGQAELMTIPAIAGGAFDADVCRTDAKKMIATGTADASSMAGTLVQSTDGGGAWKELKATTKTDEYVFMTAYHPYDCNVLIVATSTGAVRMSDSGGEQWTDLAMPSTMLTTYQHMRALPGAGNSGMLLIVGTGGIMGANLSVFAM